MLRVRTWAATILSMLSLVLLAVTAAVPDWIEVVFGADPDHGNGSAELLTTIGLAVLAVASGAGAVLSWRKLRTAG
jgi:hypothetical protein